MKHKPWELERGANWGREPCSAASLRASSAQCLCNHDQLKVNSLTSNDPGLFTGKRITFLTVDLGHKVVHCNIRQRRNTAIKLKLIIRFNMKILTPSVKKMKRILTRTALKCESNHKEHIIKLAGRVHRFPAQINQCERH